MKLPKLNFSGNKRVLIALVAVVAVAAIGFLLWGNQASAAEYITAKVDRGNLRNTVTATGTLQAVTTVQVGSQASGTISALNADFNSKVKKGQVVAQLDPSTFQAQVAQARANLVQARAAVAQAQGGIANSHAGVNDAQAKALAAKSTVQNQQAGVTGAQANLAVSKAEMDDAQSYLNQEAALVKSGVISNREYQQAETTFKTAQAKYNQAAAQVNQAMLTAQSSADAGIAQSQAAVQQSQAQVQQSQGQFANAQAQVQQAEAALQLAELNLSHTTITSPIDGVVVSRNVDVGQTVAASLSAPTLFTIANDLSKMQVIANIDQADIGLVEQAKEATFTVDAFPGAEFKGTIEEMRLNPQTVQNVVTYNVVIDVDNPELKLKPGMTANLDITIDKRDNVVKVPNAALRFTPQDSSDQKIQEQTQGANGNTPGQGRQRSGRQQADNAANPAGNNGNTDGKFAPSTAPVLAGQVRRVWVLAQNGKPQPRRVQIGLTDGSATEVVGGDLKEGDVVITGQNLTAKSQSSSQTAPGFGGAPRTGGARMGGGAGGSGGGGRGR
jgi:HlyD family secretion protein